MKQISINNGMSFVEPENAIEALSESAGIKNEDAWETIIGYMDDETLSALDSMNPCTELEFLYAYLKEADEDLIIG